jgi:hypothetical protein
MDEVTLLIDLLSTQWATNANALNTAGVISSTPLPEFIDIRSITANKGKRVDMGRFDTTAVVFEDSQNIEYPTVHYDVRHETYNFTIHLRTLHDERGGFDASYGKDRLRAIYLILRRVIESNRKGYSASDDSGHKFDLIFLGPRSESNDRAKKLFGYKVTVEAKRFALALP